MLEVRNVHVATHLIMIVVFTLVKVKKLLINRCDDVQQEALKARSDSSAGMQYTIILSQCNFVISDILGGCYYTKLQHARLKALRL